MKTPPISLALLSLLTPLVAQEVATKWDVQLPPPIVQAEPQEAAQTEAETVPEPEFTVLATRTKRVDVKEAPEMPDLPPVEGTINLTIEKVSDPGLPDPPPPLPPLPPDDPAVLARLAEFRETYRGTELAFVSASVYDGKRTLLRIYPNGQPGKEVVAWSNLNFMYLSGNGGYRVNYPDGTYQDYMLLLGVGPVNSATERRLAARAGREYEAPEIPQLPDVATAGPSFVLLEGEQGSHAMDVLEQLHDLFKVSGDTLKEQYFAREKAREERRAYLLANPPKPEDVTVRVWKRTRTTQNNQEEAR